MPFKRKEDPSPPSMLRWLKAYYASLPKMVEEGRIYKEDAAKVAKGLRYTIKALEGNINSFKKEKRREAENEYAAAREYFED